MSHRLLAGAHTETPVLLIVEDSPEDAEAMRRAFTRAGIPDGRVIHCSTVKQVIDYLERRGEFAERGDLTLPRLMILDLNMPGLDGKAMLRRIKGEERWCTMPVVVLTSSTRTSDVEECYQLGANSYICKPSTWEETVELAANTKHYWFDTVLTPVLKR